MQPSLAQAPEAQYIKQFDVMPSVEWDDLWERAQMGDVLRYLKGGFSLDLPEDWEGYLPNSPKLDLARLLTRDYSAATPMDTSEM